MYREPDWEALNDLNFLLHNRLVSPLNGALAALDKAGQPANADWWHNRATSHITTAMNLVNAWSWLVQYKAQGEISERSIQPFPIQSLADWLTMQLQLVPPLIIAKNFLLRANQPALQEALFLLYDVAASQGTTTKLILDTGINGVLFRIRYTRLRPQTKPFSSLEEMEASLGQDWRGKIITFELKMAREFLRMNASELHLRDSGDKAEFVFIINRKSKAENGEVDSSLLIPSHDSQAVINIAEATLPVPNMPEPEPILAETSTAQLKTHIAPEEAWVLKPTTIKVSAEIPTAASSIRVMVPDTPFRPGGWYRPKRASTPPVLPATETQVVPVIVKVEIPEPAEPGEFKVKSRRLASKSTSQSLPQVNVDSESSPATITGPQPILAETSSEASKESDALAPTQQAETPIDTRLQITSSPDSTGQESLERK